MPLKYIGKGKHIMGLPARDLSDDEIESYAKSIGFTVGTTQTLLVDRGLYKSPPKKKDSKAKDNK